MENVKALARRLCLPEDRPVISAAAGAVLYMIVAVIYILVSGRIAYSLADSAEELHQIELIKGRIYVLVTGLMFFLISLGWWRRMRRHRYLLMQSERRAAASVYGAALVHDLGNLLMSFSGQLRKLEKNKGDEELVARMCSSFNDVINRLTVFSRKIAENSGYLKADNLSEINLAEEMESISDLSKKHPDVRRCRIKYTETPDLQVKLNRELFEHAMLNLIINAAQATGQGGMVEVSSREEDHSVLIRVEDNGPGISKDSLKKVFDAGYTTKKKGTGLGLLSVKAFAASCGGGVEIGKSKTGGCVFNLRVPLS
ncbi:MAG: sensor histidine kinase [Fibrobacterota bacterium]